MPPISLTAESFSSILGAISITAWIVVFTPQILENFRSRSASGLSFTFVVLWLVGDFFNIIGAVLQNVLWVMIVLAVYYAVADIVLLVQCILYRNPAQESHAVDHASAATPLIPKDVEITATRSPVKSIVLNVLALLAVCTVGTIAWYVAVITVPPKHHQSIHPPNLEWSLWGQVFGWISAALYLGSRVPQIIHNYRKRSTDGLSALFFLFACLGNISYVASIILSVWGEEDFNVRKYLLINLSWLAGSGGTLVLDFIILGQFLVYKDARGDREDGEDTV